MGLGGNGSGAGSAPGKPAVAGHAYSALKAIRPGTRTGLGSTAGAVMQARAEHAGILSGVMPPDWCGRGQFWHGSPAIFPIMSADIGIVLATIGMMRAPAGIAIATTTIKATSTRATDLTMPERCCRGFPISSGAPDPTVVMLRLKEWRHRGGQR